MKTVITITGIRPDFIRMSEIFKKLDQHFNHILIHTGQHYDKLLSDVFFNELDIRQPDYNLGIGGIDKEHYHQTADLSIKLVELIRSEKLNPDIILFLGDSNSVLSSVPLKKEGYTIGHIEAGMRSYDRRMFEEINRVVCDHCSDYLFVYHDNYKNKALREGISESNVFVVGNTIVEVLLKHKPTGPKLNDRIILDIHRPENFKHQHRLKNIINYAEKVAIEYSLPVYMLGFKRTLDYIKQHNINLEAINVVDLLPFKSYIENVYNSAFIISDSGTAQEEPALLHTPVIVPRDYTERPESVINNCSYMIDVNTSNNVTWTDSLDWLNNTSANRSITWLGNGDTSEQIITILKRVL